MTDIQPHEWLELDMDEDAYGLARSLVPEDAGDQTLAIALCEVAVLEEYLQTRPDWTLPAPHVVTWRGWRTRVVASHHDAHRAARTYWDGNGADLIIRAVAPPGAAGTVYVMGWAFAGSVHRMIGVGTWVETLRLNHPATLIHVRARGQSVREWAAS